MENQPNKVVASDTEIPTLTATKTTNDVQERNYLYAKPTNWTKHRFWRQIPGMDKLDVPRIRVSLKTQHKNSHWQQRQNIIRDIRDQNLLNGVSWTNQTSDNLENFRNEVSTGATPMGYIAIPSDNRSNGLSNKSWLTTKIVGPLKQLPGTP